MKKIIKILCISIFALGMSNTVFANNGDVGTIIGGITGGLIGNNFGHGSGRTAATIGGAVIGGLVGNQVGNSMDDTDRMYQGYRYSHWDEGRCYHRSYYPDPQVFIGIDGRICRHSVFINEFGDRVYATFCCHRMTPSGRCVRWEEID